jgi:hypothetical protein
MSISDLYQQLFGKNHIQDGTVIDMAEHGRVGNVSTGTAYKNVNSLSPNITELDYVSGLNPIYIGTAAPGSLTSTAVWQIKKLTYDGNNNPTVILAANGTTEFNQIWDNRAALSYS